MLKLPELKLFKVTKTEYYDRGSKKLFEKYFLAENYDIISKYVIEQFGYIGEKHYQGDEGCDEITIEEKEVEYVENRNSGNEDY